MDFLWVAGVVHRIEVAQQVDVAADVILHAIGTTRLDIDKIDTVFDRMTIVGTVPSAFLVLPVSPVVKLLTMPIKDVGMELDNTLRICLCL